MMILLASTGNTFGSAMIALVLLSKYVCFDLSMHVAYIFHRMPKITSTDDKATYLNRM